MTSKNHKFPNFHPLHSIREPVQ